jgi:GH18 family chitinase
MSYDIHGPWEKNAEHNSPLFAREDEIEEDGQKNVVGI